MSDNEEIERTSLVDSTHRYSWQITKEKFENCDYQQGIISPTFIIDINGKPTQWYIHMYPKGRSSRNKVDIILWHKSELEIYKVSFKFAIKTRDGYSPEDFEDRGSFDDENYFGRKKDKDDDRVVVDGSNFTFSTTKEFKKYFVENKVTFVTYLVIYYEGDKYRNHMEISDEFMDNMRSISSQENLTDFTIISGNERFPCHRVLLAVRSEYFEALFRNEPTKTEVHVDESPEMVKTMLEFMSKGHVPQKIDDEAMDLILMADKYRLDYLTIACETSLLNNLSPNNALETLITIDKVKHISKQEHRLKVLAYINKKANQVVKSKDWKKFVQNYPDLITEILLLK